MVGYACILGAAIASALFGGCHVGAGGGPRSGGVHMVLLHRPLTPGERERASYLRGSCSSLPGREIEPQERPLRGVSGDISLVERQERGTSLKEETALKGPVMISLQ